MKKNNEIPSLVLQYRGNLGVKLKEKLNTAAEINVIFTTRKLKACLPTLKTGFEKHLKSHVVYQIILVDLISPMLGRPADILPQQIRSIKKQTPQLDSI